MRRLARTLPLALLVAAAAARAQAPAPAILTTLPAPDAAGRVLLKDRSEAIYELFRPVATGASGILDVSAPEGGRAEIICPGGNPAFLSNYQPYTPQPWQWQADGGVRLVKSRTPADADGNALCLWDLNGRWTWPGPAPRQWSGLKSWALELDCALARWEGIDSNPVDLWGLYAADGTPAPVALVAFRGGLALTLVDATGPRSFLGIDPGGPAAPGARRVVRVALDNVKGTWAIQVGGVPIGSGTFAAPLGEAVDGQFCIGGQRMRMHHDPDMVFHRATLEVDGQVGAVLLPPAAPDWFWPGTFALSHRDEDGTGYGLPSTNFRRLSISNAGAAIGYGATKAPATIDACEFVGGNVGLWLGVNPGPTVYPIRSDRCTWSYQAVAAIQASSAVATIRDASISYYARHAVLGRGLAMTLDAPMLAPGTAGAAVFKLTRTNDSCSLLVRGGILDYEGFGPPAYLDADATGQRAGGMAVVFDGTTLGDGPVLAALRAAPGTPAGAGRLMLRDCTGGAFPPPAAPPGWAVAGLPSGPPAPQAAP